MMKLSIVLTVYNKEQYLRRAFDALLAQEGTSGGDYEILVVNDGSTDGSSAIIEEIARENKLISVLTQKNQGLSMARNNGVDAAKGEYVWFVDADDVVSPQAVSLFLKAIESRPDVIPIYAKTEGEDRVRNCISPHVTTGKEVIFDKTWEHCGVFYICRRRFLKENNLCFIPGIYHEDSEFTPRLLYYAKTIKVVPEVLYKVFRDPNSITQVPRAKRAFDYLTVAESLSEFVENCGETKTEIGKEIYDNAAMDINNAFDIICQNDKEEQIKLNVAFYKVRKKMIHTLLCSIQWKYKLEALLFMVLPKCYVGVYKSLKLIG